MGRHTRVCTRSPDPYILSDDEYTCPAPPPPSVAASSSDKSQINSDDVLLSPFVNKCSIVD